MDNGRNIFNMENILKTMDKQLHSCSPKLTGSVKLAPDQCRNLATAIAREAYHFSSELKEIIKSSSPIPISERLQVAEASLHFNATCTRERFENESPGLAYAHTITMVYVSVVYFGESLFDIIKKGTPPPSISVMRKCVEYLRENPIRAFRNAFAHGNWKVMQIPEVGIEYWARPGQNKEEPMKPYNVSQEDLVFWYTLSRSVSYAILLGINSGESPGSN